MLMGRLSLLMTVVSRNLGEKYLKFYLEQQVEVQLVTLGRGTANDAMLDYFGLESHEKAVLFSVVDDQKWEELSVGLHRSMRIDVPGTGVAFLIPLASIGGRGIFTYLTRTLETGMPETGNTPANEKTDRKRFREKRRTGKREADEAAAGQNGQYGAAEGSETMPESAYEMIIAVANQGYIEPIMEAARSAGAGGGTVIHAKGTGMEGMGKFFGVSLAAEKEMIFIVTERGQKQAIMRAIMERAGMESKARTFLFSVPVDEVAGLDTSSR